MIVLLHFKCLGLFIPIPYVYIPLIMFIGTSNLIGCFPKITTTWTWSKAIIAYHMADGWRS